MAIVYSLGLTHLGLHLYKSSALPLLRKDLGLIYCHSGDWINGLAELLEAQNLRLNDVEITQAISLACSWQR
jgi:hypothetical protein